MDTSRWMISLTALLGLAAAAAGAKNLAANPSFERVRAADVKAGPFPGWYCGKWEGQCEFHVSPIAHSGKRSALLVGRSGPKMRIQQSIELDAGRYRITAYLRGLDIGKGIWNTTTEFMFDGQENKNYFQLKKNGTFGWTKLTYVADIEKRRKVLGPSFGTWAPGYFWVDDVTVERVGKDVALTPQPVLGKEEGAVVPPGKLDGTAVRCPECRYRNMKAWKTCFACGTDLAAKKAVEVATGPPVKRIASFETDCPFRTLDGPAPATVVAQHATHGKKAMRLDNRYNNMFGEQVWSGYDYLKLDVYTDAKAPMSFGVCITDTGSSGYWTWVNYNTKIPPGASTVVLPIKTLCVGEKARPGRLLDLGGIRRFGLIIDEKPPAPVFVDNIRLERDDQARKAFFDGLYAFDFQKDNASPVLDGFEVILPSTAYSEGKGYGLKDAKGLWGADVYRPDPLYQDFFCITAGGFALDVPNGTYRVIVNINRPCGYWGNIQRFGSRAVRAQGKQVYAETWTEAAAKKRWFRHWKDDDLPGDNTFDKYVGSFDELVFDVKVTDGRLLVEFQGDADGCDVSALIVFPLARRKQGENFLKFVRDRRRFYFEQSFHRVLHTPTGDPPAPTAAEKARGYQTFVRDVMKEVFYNDTPLKGELGKPAGADVFAGEYAPLTVSVRPLVDLGKVTVTIGDLVGPGGTIPASAVDVGYVSYRNRGIEVYSIGPRYIMPMNAVDMPKGITRRFWLTARVGADAKAGLYKGKMTIRPEKGSPADVAVTLRVRAGALDEVDVPAGPWGYQVPYIDDVTCLKKIREYGFNFFSSGAVITCRFKDGKPDIDYARADKLMATAKELGFRAVMFYGSLVGGYNAYFQDRAAMSRCGFTDYSKFLKALFADVHQHAVEKGWLPYFVNLCDEPRGDALPRSAANAEAYRKAFPKGPPFFTGATSVADIAKDPGHFRLAKALHVANLNDHSEASVKAIHAAGSQWGFYNGGNRWTYGDYMYKAAKQFGMKFRITWHWNLSMGDPYYALDGTEDEFAWCNAGPDGELIPSIEFELHREGLGDYRRLLTLARLAKAKPAAPAARAGEKLIADRLASFKLGQRDHDALFGHDDWNRFRGKINDAIEALRK